MHASSVCVLINMNARFEVMLGIVSYIIYYSYIISLLTFDKYAYQKIPFSCPMMIKKLSVKKDTTLKKKC